MATQPRPIERGEGGSFPGPATEKGVSNGFFLTSNMHKIRFRPGQRGEGRGRVFAPDPAGGAYDAALDPSRMVRGHPSPRFLLSTPLASRSRRIRNEVVIGPRDKGFPGPAVHVALDRPDPSHSTSELWLRYCCTGDCALVTVGRSERYRHDNHEDNADSDDDGEDSMFHSFSSCSPRYSQDHIRFDRVSYYIL